MKNECKRHLAILLCFALICAEFPPPTHAFSSSARETSGRSVLGANSRSFNGLVTGRESSAGFPFHGMESLIRGLRGSSLRARAVPRQESNQSQPINLLNLPGQSSTVLPDGRILVLGGESKDGPVNTGFIKDPSSGQTTQLQNGLLHPLAYHTSTILPDGTVFIFGGITQGNKLESAEIFDPTSLKFRELATTGLTPRSSHTATVLTDGRLLIAGGVSVDGTVLASIEFWDYRAQASPASAAQLIVPRRGHTATLQPDGTVLFWGGFDSYGNPLNYGEAFDPTTQTARIESNPQQVSQLSPLVEASIPTDEADSVATNALISVRFSKPLQVQTLNSNTVVLSNTDGAVTTKVVPDEAGMLVFVTPETTLEPGTQYSLLISGASDPTGTALPGTTITFTTAGESATGTAGDAGATGTSGAGTGGSSDPFNSPYLKLPPLQAPPGVTAIAGQSLQLDGNPLKGVSLQIGNKQAKTDDTGRFLLEQIPSGHQVMWIVGTSANSKSATYGIYEVGVDIAAGITNVLNYTIWMTPIDTAHQVTIPSPTQSETVVSNPNLPGLELHIPAQTTIVDWYGKTVTTISVTPISVKQPPFPLPKDVLVPTYFTIQPGGAYLYGPNGSTQGAQLYYPNTYHFPAGTVFNFYNYDPENKGWYVYGQGRVASDRNQIVPNPGVAIYGFTGAMVSQPSNAPSNGPKPHNPNDGDPVDLQTGLFVYNKTDLILPDVIPLVLKRIYRQNDYISRSFGIGTNDSFDFFMVGDNNTWPEGYTYQDLILPDGGRVHFARTSPCNGSCSFANAVYQAVPSGTEFDGATIQWASGGFAGASWLLTKKDGTTIGFPDSDASTVPQAAAPVGMKDRYGNTVTFTRDSNHNLTQITSPNGRWIQFTYDSTNRITQAQDNIGRTVKYTYDSGGRLWTVTDPNNGVTTFTYDSNNNMLTVQDARQITYLTTYYDSNGRVYKQVQADNSTYQYSYTLDSNGNVTQTNVTDPRGNGRQVSFNSDGYPVTDIRALGKPEQQTFTYNRQPGSGLILSVTDPLNRTTANTFDSLGNLTSFTRLVGTQNPLTTTLGYDPTFNETTSITDPLGNTTSFALDQNGNIIAATDPLGNTTTAAYNSAGQIVSSTDPVGSTTQFSYDSGDLVGITDPLGRTVSRFIDAGGRLLSVTDALGRITKFAYNPLNQITNITDPLGNVTSFGYDANGNLTSVTDPRNTSNPSTYTYDNMDRLATGKDALGNQESYQYDGKSNLVQYTDRRGKVSAFNYDGLNRKVFAGFGQSGSSYESTINYTFDSQNRLTQIADSITGTITRGYDNLDRLTSETTPQGSISYTYDSADRLTTKTVAGQPTVNYGYDNGSRLTQITQGTSTVQFSYDPASRQTSITLPNGVVESYSYDAASEVLGVSYSLGSNSLGNLAYGYDQAGRRAQETGTLAQTGLPQPVSTTAYNASNQLMQWGTATPLYDANGNMLTDGTNTYSWDARNRLVSMNSGGATFQYDPFGRRVTKATILGTTNYLYDGVNPVQELSGTNPTANLLAGGTDEFFQRTDSNGPANFLTDPLGGTVAVTDAGGNTLTQYSYEPFGNTTVTGTSTNPYQYTGRENDSTGLYLYRSRYYSPTLQRFISEDPIGFAGGVNKYAYVGNDPVDAIDPTGNVGEGCAIGAGIGAFFGGVGALPGCGAGEVIADVLEVIAAGAMVATAIHVAQTNSQSQSQATDSTAGRAKCKNDNDCDELLREIGEYMAWINEEIEALLTDPLNLYNLARTAPNPSLQTATYYEGHREEVENLQIHLRNLLVEAQDQGCPIPPGAWKVATQPIPTRPRRK